MIIKVFRSRTELRLKNKEKNFKFNTGGEGTSIKYVTLEGGLRRCDSL